MQIDHGGSMRLNVLISVLKLLRRCKLTFPPFTNPSAHMQANPRSTSTLFVVCLKLSPGCVCEMWKEGWRDTVRDGEMFVLSSVLLHAFILCFVLKERNCHEH